MSHPTCNDNHEHCVHAVQDKLFVGICCNCGTKLTEEYKVLHGTYLAENFADLTEEEQITYKESTISELTKLSNEYTSKVDALQGAIEVLMSPDFGKKV